MHNLLKPWKEAGAPKPFRLVEVCFGGTQLELHKSAPTRHSREVDDEKIAGLLNRHETITFSTQLGFVHVLVWKAIIFFEGHVS